MAYGYILDVKIADVDWGVGLLVWFIDLMVHLVSNDRMIVNYETKSM
jgi:hypothetical protein